MPPLLLLIKQDLRTALARTGGIAYPLLFFIITIILFPLAIGPESSILKQIGSGIIWVMALLASLLPLSELFEEDHKDGTLEQLFVAGITPSSIVTAKMASYWLTTGAPLLITAPLLALMFSLPGQAIMMLFASLLLGTPLLCLVNGMAAALMLGANRNSGLIFLVALPLTIPVLIFGAAAGGVETFTAAQPAFIALIALLLIIIPISITVCGLAIRANNT